MTNTRFHAFLFLHSAATVRAVTERTQQQGDVVVALSFANNEDHFGVRVESLRIGSIEVSFCVEHDLVRADLKLAGLQEARAATILIRLAGTNLFERFRRRVEQMQGDGNAGCRAALGRIKNVGGYRRNHGWLEKCDPTRNVFTGLCHSVLNRRPDRSVSLSGSLGY